MTLDIALAEPFKPLFSGYMTAAHARTEDEKCFDILLFVWATSSNYAIIPFGLIIHRSLHKDSGISR